MLMPPGETGRASVWSMLCRFIRAFSSSDCPTETAARTTASGGSGGAEGVGGDGGTPKTTVRPLLPPLSFWPAVPAGAP